MVFLFRILIIVALTLFDAAVIKNQYERNGQLPFSLPASVRRRVEEILPSPVPTPIPLQNGLEVSDASWVGSIVYGKITNHNPVAVVSPVLSFSLSSSKDLSDYLAGYTATISARIKPNESMYFSQRFPMPEAEMFWWAASILQTASDSGQVVPKPPRGQQVSQKPIKAPIVARVPSDTTPWGVAKQIDDVTWTIKVGEDARIGTPQEIYSALNDYRNTHASPRLEWDETLAQFARERAKHLNSLKSTDQHTGFKEYVANEDNVRKLGFASLGENSGYGHKLLGVHLIEWIYAGDPAHNSNQLSTQWSHVGIGVDGLAVVFIFGGNKM